VDSVHGVNSFSFLVEKRVEIGCKKPENGEKMVKNPRLRNAKRVSKNYH